MSQPVNLQKAYDNAEALRELEIPASSQLPFDLVLGRHKQTTKLLANSGSDITTSGANKWYEYSFSEPVFLNEISISEENYASYNEFEFRWRLATGEEVSTKLSKDSGKNYRAPINQLVSQVSFRPPKKWWAEVKINRVTLIGFPQHELHNFIELVSNLEDYQTKIIADVDAAIKNAEQANKRLTAVESERDARLAEITSADQSIKDLTAKIGGLTEQRQNLLDEITKREELISTLDKRRSEVHEQITEREVVREGLVKKIAELKQELRDLQDDVNMFPTEISAFVTQGGKSVTTYGKLAAVPILLMVVVTSLLVFNAANLTTVFDEDDKAKIWSILVTRLPYVFIATAIITASYKLVRLFVGEIMRINQQRLNLSKISIIATDTSNASQKGLTGLSDRDIYELRTDLKMQLLRDHLKEYISKDFKYQQKSKFEMPNFSRKQKDVEDEIKAGDNPGEE
ncbi:hypothetical protein [Thioclava sp. GXIMD4215]|uniref:hypothetical protein n=1 Tax=Thioclava sp. GXIMD4215 TaxID=3131928 RepID=UPI00324DF76A